MVRYKRTDLDNPKILKISSKISFLGYPWKDTSWYKLTGMYMEACRSVYMVYQSLQQPKVGLLISRSLNIKISS